MKGKIVIARYGAGWRGLKPKLAAEHGAVGCIVYSDPADDGYGAGDAYPKGAFRPERGLQRGSVLDMPVEAGDPLTPGYGAVEGAPRLALGKAKTILHIPAVPISWGDAQHFLAALGGPVAPKAWRGQLGFTYHVGGGPGASAHLLVQANWDQKPLYDVIAVMKGARSGPISGWCAATTATAGSMAPRIRSPARRRMMEEAKSLGALAKAAGGPSAP